MYKKILVPLDGTKRAEAILPQVEALAKQCDAALVLLEVLEPLPPHAVVVVPEMLQAGVSQRTADINRYVQDIAEGLCARGFDAKGIVARGQVVDTILTTAETEGIDLIAMASHGYTGLARLLHGSIAAEVLHRARTPLLVLHAEEA